MNSEASEANALNISVGSSEVEFDGVIGGGTNGSLGAITITGALDLDAALTSATSLSVSTTSNLGANVTTSSTQTYTGAVTISTDGVTLTTTNSQITFSSTVNSEASEANALNISVGSSEVEFDGVIGGAENGDLGAITITGALDLDAALTSATSLSVVLATKLAWGSDLPAPRWSTIVILYTLGSKNRLVMGLHPPPGPPWTTNTGIPQGLPLCSTYRL